jgi:membrane protease YdiL (CAAX protease family)
MAVELSQRNIQSETVGTTPVQVQPNQDEPSGFCSRMAYGVVNCVKNFGLGVAAAGIITPLTRGTSYLAQLGGLLPEITLEGQVRQVITNFQSQGLNKFNEESLLNATCYLEEVTKQYNSHFPSMPNKHLTPLIMKISAALMTGVIVPLQEEIFFRGLLQDVLLTRIPKFIVKKIAPGNETVLDTTIAKAARILLTSAAFSAAHLSNEGVESDSFVAVQLVSAFMIGIGFGLLKESKAGLLGSIAAHMVHNFAALAPTLLDC